MPFGGFFLSPYCSVKEFIWHQTYVYKLCFKSTGGVNLLTYYLSGLIPSKILKLFINKMFKQSFLFETPRAVEAQKQYLYNNF